MPSDKIMPHAYRRARFLTWLFLVQAIVSAVLAVSSYRAGQHDDAGAVGLWSLSCVGVSLAMAGAARDERERFEREQG